MRIVALTLALFVIVPLVPASAVEPEVDDAVLNGGFEIAAHPLRPLTCLLFGDGYTNLFQPGNPFGLPWLLSVSPCHAGAVKALGWSSGQTVDVQDFDNDGDRETRFLAGSSDPQLGNHNLWQAYPNPQQAYVADFSALSLNVESGTVPAGAVIQLSLTMTPVADAHPYAVLFIDCSLTFTGLGGMSGLISLDPTTATFRSVYSGDELADGCDALQAEWDAASPGSDARRGILAGLRIVQHSYWSWNSGSGDVTIDDISLVDSRTAVEALLL